MRPESAQKPPAEAQGEGHGVSEPAIRAELERVLCSAPFREAELLKRFLRYIVERTLSGEADSLKEYRLGVEVFERDSSFDPRLDPVVRMNARRLRTKLEEYYRSPGAPNALRIDVPKGSYAARFLKAPDSEPAKPEAVSKPAASDAFFDARSAAGLIIALVVLAIVAYLFKARHTEHLSAKNTVVVADFVNSTGDHVFDETLKTALVISLEQSPFIQVTPDQKLSEILQTMKRPSDTKLSGTLLRELCQRAGSEAYIAGSIAALGSEYVLDVKALNCVDGSSLAEEQLTASSKEKVLDTLGHMARELRAELGESLTTVQKFDVPLVEATTGSLEALKVFSIGQKVYSERGPEASLPYNLKAIEIDPNFALGYFQAGADYHSLDQPGRAREYLTRAFELREHASQREELAIEAYYFRNVTGELDKAIQSDEEETETYPRDINGYIRLGVDFASRGDYSKAREVTMRAEQLAPDHVVPYDNLSAYTLALQSFDETQQDVVQAHARKLDNYMLHAATYALDFIKGDLGSAMREQSWFLANPQLATYGLVLAADTEAYVGQLPKAEQLTDKAVEAAIRTDNKEAGAIWRENSALWEAAYGYPVKAKDFAAKGMKLAPESQGVQIEAALAFAMAGDVSSAERTVRQLEKAYPLDTQAQTIWLPTIRAQLALNQERPSQALNDLQAASGMEMGLVPFINNVSCLYPTYVRGNAFLQAGQGDAAASEFQKIMDHTGMVWNCWTGALAHVGLARAYVLQATHLQGRDFEVANEKASGEYKAFLTLWKDAEPDSPILKQAKTEYARALP